LADLHPLSFACPEQGSTWSHPNALWASPRAACYWFYNLLLTAGPAETGALLGNTLSLLCAGAPLVGTEDVANFLVSTLMRRTAWG